jgi:hypothetical protein
MKRLIRVIGRHFLSALFTISLLVVFYLILRSYSPGILFHLPAATPTPATTPTSVITGTLSYSDALSTYEKVSTRAIDASQRTVEMMKWLVVSILSTLVTTLVSAGIYLYKASQETAEQAKLAEAAAQNARNAADDVKTRIASLSEQYDRLSERYISLSDKQAELRGKTLSLDAALRAGDRGDISRDELIETQQLHSLRKWTQRRDDTGLDELYEDVRAGAGLTPQVRSALERELEKMRQRSRERGTRSSRDELYEQKLMQLLSSVSEE